MRRTLAPATVAILAAAVIHVPGPLPTGTADRAAAADCSWQRHTKRVVKHLRRGGELRRVVRKRHWWSCIPRAAGPAPGAPSGAFPEPVPAPGPEPPPEPGPARLSVKALEYSFTLSRPSLAAGEAIVELDNQGEDPNNLNLRREGDGEPTLEVSEAGSLERRVGHFNLVAGTYRLWCSLPEHDELGMNATLVVAGA